VLKVSAAEMAADTSFRNVGDIAEPGTVQHARAAIATRMPRLWHSGSTEELAVGGRLRAAVQRAFC